MKTKEIASKYNIDRNNFETFLVQQRLDYSAGITNYTVKDENVESYVEQFNEYNEKEKRQLQAAEKAEAEAEALEWAEAEFKKKAMAEVLITSGFTFDGYTITKYSGYISGDDATEIPRYGLFKDNGQNLTDALVRIRRKALIELKEAAYALGCNAVIGVDFDYLTLEPERNAMLSDRTKYEPYVICVTANGNAVVIEKNQTNVTQAFKDQQ